MDPYWHAPQLQRSAKFSAVGPRQCSRCAIESPSHGGINSNYLKDDVAGKASRPQWLTVRDENGQRRLDNPDDYVRIEIETALKRKILVIIQ